MLLGDAVSCPEPGESCITNERTNEMAAFRPACYQGHLIFNTVWLVSVPSLAHLLWLTFAAAVSGGERLGTRQSLLPGFWVCLGRHHWESFLSCAVHSAIESLLPLVSLCVGSNQKGQKDDSGRVADPLIFLWDLFLANLAVAPYLVMYRVESGEQR